MQLLSFRSNCLVVVFAPVKGTFQCARIGKGHPSTTRKAEAYATPPTVTAPTTPGNRWGRVLPHSTDPAQPQTSPDNPAGAHGVAILRRHFRLSKPPVFPLQILFFSLWHPIFLSGAAFVGCHETSRFRLSEENRSDY